jgi:hypothetical protein
MDSGLAATAAIRNDADGGASGERETMSKQNFLKRRTAEQGLALVDAAHVATWRLYCDALRLWRHCSMRGCQHHRHCHGTTNACLQRGLMFVPPSRRLRARQEVIAGGPRRVPPASHMEWQVRREALHTVLSWKLR